jgi:hypothetical protein
MEKEWASPKSGLDQIWKDVPLDEKSELQSLILSNF